MSSKTRRAEKRKEWEEESARIDAERRRKDALTMWQRIEEADLSADLKDILHRLDERAGASHADREYERDNDHG